MDMTEKNGQPSMEEILASIRRIIAEEPADSISLDFKPRQGQGPGPGPGNGAEHLVIDDASDFELPSMFRASTASAAAEKSAGTPVKLMDALRSTPQLGSEFNGRPQPDFPMPANSAPAYQAPVNQAPVNQTNGHETSRTSAWADVQASAHQALSSLRQTARPDTPAAETNGHHMQAFTVPSIETAAVLASTEPAWAPGPAQMEPVNQTQPAFEVFPNVQSPESSGPPVARQMTPFRDQHFARMRGGLPSNPAPAAPVEVAVEPVLQFTAPVAVEPAPAPLNEASFATLAVNSGYPQPLHVLNLSATPPALPIFGNTPVAAAPAAPAIDDATAELLRPMLRQWLSDNMPRMVEKALHIEVAESAKPGKKPGTI